MKIKNLYEVKGNLVHEKTVFSWRILRGEEIGNENLVFIDDDLVEPGVRIKPHRDGWDEVYYILNGIGEMEIGGEKRNVNEGDIIHIPRNELHSLKNRGKRNLRFICVGVRSKEGEVPQLSPL
jgi:quercetin dioxygenase-like cupin family protein